MKVSLEKNSKIANVHSFNVLAILGISILLFEAILGYMLLLCLFYNIVRDGYVDNVMQVGDVSKFTDVPLIEKLSFIKDSFMISFSSTYIGYSLSRISCVFVSSLIIYLEQKYKILLGGNIRILILSLIILYPILLKLNKIPFPIFM